jgi:hypothetical protein
MVIYTFLYELMSIIHFAMFKGRHITYLPGNAFPGGGGEFVETI